MWRCGVFSLWGTWGLMCAYELTTTRAISAAQTAQQETERTLRARSAFLANMSHEIRTPINIILGLSRMMQSAPLDERQQENNRLILSSGEHLLHLINQSLDLSKMQAGRLSLEALSFSPALLVEEVVGLLQGAARDKGLSLDLALHVPGDRWVRGDPNRLRQVLINLISNAIKFTDNGSVTVTLRSTPGGELAFSITDTGIGIAASQQQRLFQPFTQADASTTRRFGGTGLGLTISQQLVEHMGGELSVESDLGEGATFRFTLALPESAPPAHRPSDRPPLPTARILVAEDNLLNQRVVRHHLEQLGFQPRIVSDGQQAIEVLCEQHFDLILMDCHMPEVDGFEAARIIRREHPDGPPIVALSASALDDDVSPAAVAVELSLEASHPPILVPRTPRVARDPRKRDRRGRTRRVGAPVRSGNPSRRHR